MATLIFNNGEDTVNLLSYNRTGEITRPVITVDRDYVPKPVFSKFYFSIKITTVDFNIYFYNWTENNTKGDMEICYSGIHHDFLYNTFITSVEQSIEDGVGYSFITFIFSSFNTLTVVEDDFLDKLLFYKNKLIENFKK